MLRIHSILHQIRSLKLPDIKFFVVILSLFGSVFFFLSFFLDSDPDPDDQIVPGPLDPDPQYYIRVMKLTLEPYVPTYLAIGSGSESVLSDWSVGILSLTLRFTETGSIGWSPTYRDIGNNKFNICKNMANSLKVPSKFRKKKILSSEQNKYFIWNYFFDRKKSPQKVGIFSMFRSVIHEKDPRIWITMICIRNMTF